MSNLIGMQAPIYPSYEAYAEATPSPQPQVSLPQQVPQLAAPLGPQMQQQQQALGQVLQTTQEALPSMPLTGTLEPTFFQQYGTRLNKKDTDLEKTALQNRMLQQLQYSPLLSARMAGAFPYSIY